MKRKSDKGHTLLWNPALAGLLPRTAAALVVLATLGVVAFAQQAPPRQVTISSAAPDPSGQTVTIHGENFGSRPLVTLDLVPVTVQFAVDSQIVVAVPVKVMPAGQYLLTVSRGPAPADNASYQLTLTGVQPPPPASPSPAAATPDSNRLPASSDQAAKVGDRVLTVDDVDREWSRTDPAGYLAFLRQLYDARRRVTDRMVTDQLIAREAASRGLTVEALLAEEIPKRIVTTPETAVLALYEGLGDRARGASLEQLRPALRAWLTKITEPELAKMNYVEELMKVSTRAEVFLEAPRVQVERRAQDPVLGSPTASVEIVAFGDFDSAEYARLAQAFRPVRDMFGDRVRFVFKNLPLIGPESMTIAQAAACANAQGKFWAYHDAVIVRSGPIDTARLKQIASDVGLNRSAFDPCVDRDEFEAAMRQALSEAEGYAITASPSLLVNGRLAPVPPPFLPPAEYFKRLIEEELLRQSKQNSINRH